MSSYYERVAREQEAKVLRYAYLIGHLAGSRSGAKVLESLDDIARMHPHTTTSIPALIAADIREVVPKGRAA